METEHDAIQSDILMRDRKQRAIFLVKTLVDTLSRMGVTTKVIGSLPTDRFNIHSDIDLLITECPRSLKYRIEGIVEDALVDFKFNVVYLDEIPPHRLHRFTDGMTDPHDL